MTINEKSLIGRLEVEEERDLLKVEVTQTRNPTVILILDPNLNLYGKHNPNLNPNPNRDADPC